ncbi:tetratricopeptide repeat protein [Acinetobacter sp. HZNU-JH01]|uniref:tetratricopeptide repeat protein n=1 Tax=Acinetobacter sp. HZNU-JH01 TaxID=3136280 RepID=UPI0030F42444
MKKSKKQLLSHTLFTLSLLFPLQAVMSAEADFVKEGDAAYKPGNPIYDRWDQFYKLEQQQPEQAEKILLELAALTPQDIKVWKSLTYLQIRLNKQDQALYSVRKASQLAPQDDQLKLQEAYLLNQLQRDRDALPIFKMLAQSNDVEIATKAQQAVQNLSGGTVKPVFKDIYFAPSYESRYDDFIFPLKMRYGRNWDNGRAQVYGFMNLNRDTKSRGGVRPEIIDENAVTVGVGANYQPWLSIPIRAYLELGGSYDLIDRNRDKFRESVVGGVTGYQEWYANPSVENRTVWNDYFTDLYGNVASYSREDYNVIADLRLRSGFNVYRGETGTVQAYAKLHALADSEGENYNNLFEYGAGVAWQPFNYLPVKVRVERLYGHYFKDALANGQERYNNTRTELVFYKSF